MTISMQKTGRILVTGGAGFLGSHLCERLIDDGNEVVCVDNLFTGSRNNILHLLNNSRFQFVQHDVCSPLNIDVDQIYNLACPASPVHYQFDPIQTTKTSVLGAINMLDLARRVNCRIFQASTSEVYGDPMVHPQIESYCGNVNPIGPRACYDEGKRCAETLFADYRRTHGVSIRVARIFNTYGPRMDVDDGRVVSNFIVQALRGQPITVYGAGTQTRSFCFVEDLVDGFVRLMNAPTASHEPTNLGNPNEVTVADLAKMVVEATGSRSKIVFKGLPEDDPMKRRPDISRARQTLDWMPRISLSDGLARTIEYFAAILSQNPPRRRASRARRIDPLAVAN